MSQIRMNAYDADVYLPEFKGLMQYGDQMGGDLRFSPNCINIDTPGGVLQPAVNIDGAEIKLKDPDNEGQYLNPATIGTFMYFRDKYVGNQSDSWTSQTGNNEVISVTHGSRSSLNLERNMYYIAAHGHIYKLYAAGDLKESGTYELEILGVVNGTTPITDPFRTDRWSWTTYELTDTPTGETNSITRNVLLISNPLDGMFVIDPYYANLPSIQGQPGGAIMHRVTTPTTFAWIERYADRIWGVGAGRYEDDTIYYSRPFNCKNWTANTTSPADGGGEIREPSWDKDKFVALKAFGDNLIAFTKKRAWKISGTDPSNFSIQEQYGNGCLYPDTIVDMGKYLLMLGEDSLVTYDGYNVTPFMKEYTKEILGNIGWDDYTKPCAVRVGDRYVLGFSNDINGNLNKTYAQTFKRGSSEVMIGYTVVTDGTTQEINTGKSYLNLVYNMTDKTITLCEAPQIVSMNKLMPYVFTYEPVNGTTPAKNKICKLRFDSWEEQNVTTKATKWVSPWVTFGRQDIKKGGFELYFTPEVRKKKVISGQWWTVENLRGGDDPSQFVSTETAGNVTLKFSIQTEKKTKTKTYTVTALTDTEIAAGKEYKMKRLHFGGAGRRFRLIIETAAGNTIPWRLIGGIHIIAETDKD